MKIRTDYVSNSSSSSFVLIGEKMDVAKFDVESFATLGENEVFLLILPNSGSEGDYMFVLTPELLMDFDLRQLKFTKSSLPLLRVKYYISEGGYLFPANTLKKLDSDEYWSETEDLWTRKSCKDGVELPSGCRMFNYSKDYGNPRDRTEVLDAIERALKYDFANP